MVSNHPWPAPHGATYHVIRLAVRNPIVNFYGRFCLCWHDAILPYIAKVAMLPKWSKCLYALREIYALKGEFQSCRRAKGPSTTSRMSRPTPCQDGHSSPSLCPVTLGLPVGQRRASTGLTTSSYFR